MKTSQAFDGLDDAVFYGQIEKEERDILDKQVGTAATHSPTQTPNPTGLDRLARVPSSWWEASNAGALSVMEQVFAA